MTTPIADQIATDGRWAIFAISTGSRHSGYDVARDGAKPEAVLLGHTTYTFETIADAIAYVRDYDASELYDC